MGARTTFFISHEVSSHNNPVVSDQEMKTFFFHFLPFRFTLYAVDTRGRHSELSTVTLRTACPLVDDSKAEGQSSGTSFPKTEAISINVAFPVSIAHLQPSPVSSSRAQAPVNGAWGYGAGMDGKIQISCSGGSVVLCSSVPSCLFPCTTLGTCQ